MTREGTPAFTGLILHEDKKWGFSFWYPDGWYRFSLTEGRHGVLCAPDEQDWTTSFSIEVKNLGIKVAGGDLPVLLEGFNEGLRKLPDCQIAWQDQWVVGALVGLEAKYTFREGDAVRKRWVRLLYEGKRQFHVVAQGASVDEYAYWEPMLFEAMMTLKID